MRATENFLKPPYHVTHQGLANIACKEMYICRTNSTAHAHTKIEAIPCMHHYKFDRMKR